MPLKLSAKSMQRVRLLGFFGIALGAIVALFSLLNLHVEYIAPLSGSYVNAEHIDERTALIRDWAKTNQSEDGTFPYLYNPLGGSYSTEDNVIRQLLTAQGFFALARASGDSELWGIATRYKDALFKKSYVYSAKNNYAYMLEGADTMKLGAAALAILVTRESVGFTAPITTEERLLANYIVAQQREDGSFQTFLGRPELDTNDRFYSGEALSALAELYRVNGSATYKRALDRGLSFYENKLGADFNPQYAPWHIQAYAIAHERANSKAYANYVFSLADKLVQTMLEEDSAPAGEDGRFFNSQHPEWGPVSSASTGIYVEGLTYALELARRVGDTEREDRYASAIKRGTRFLMQVQWTPENASYLDHPERVVGALRVSPANGAVRIDQVGHAANAFVRVRTLLF